MKRYAAVLLIALFALVKVNAQELIVIESKNLKCNDSVLVFTPVNVNENTSTLFLLLTHLSSTALSVFVTEKMELVH